MKIEFVKECRNKQLGDYFYRNGELVFQILQSTDINTLLVLVHEIVEFLLITKKGLSIEAVDKWDKEHDEIDAEPGRLPGCPYRYEHAFAESIERLVLAQMEKDFTEYENELIKGYGSQFAK